MMLHPGIIALNLGAFLSLLLTGRAALLAWQIVRRWNRAGSDAAQLALERQAELLGPLVRCALTFEVVALLLFVFTTDALHPLFVGAMCATGTLNLHPSGWWALLVRIALCFAAGYWLTLDRLDRSSEESPLLRRKFLLLFALVPLVALAGGLQLRFFLALQPAVVTSCCGSLFSGSDSVAADLAALPSRPAIVVCYLLLALCLLASAVSLRWPGATPRYLLSLAGTALLPAALTAIVAGISLYIYQTPTHHCPFDMLQRQHGYLGYPLYASLFGAVHFALLPGLCRPLRKHAALHAPLAHLEQRWLVQGLVCQLVFAGLISWPLIFSPLSLGGAG